MENKDMALLCEQLRIANSHKDLTIGVLTKDLANANLEIASLTAEVGKLMTKKAAEVIPISQ